MKNLTGVIDNKDIATKEYVDSAIPEEVFIATYGSTTSAELEAAYQAGKVIQVIYDTGTTKVIGEFAIRISSVYYVFATAGTSTGCILYSCESDVWTLDTVTYQEPLVSGTNIKTINNESLLGSGNISISGGGSGTSVPTADTISKFDSAAHMNSTDMTSSEVTSFINGLNMTGSKTADYVVEEGTSGIWTYRKWQSGIAECWGITPTTSYAITSTYGSLYYTDATLCTFPTNLFISVPVVNIARTPNGGVGTGLVFAAINSVTTTNVKAYIANSTSGTWNFNFSISAKGRWK